MTKDIQCFIVSSGLIKCNMINNLIKIIHSVICNCPNASNAKNKNKEIEIGVSTTSQFVLQRVI